MVKIFSIFVCLFVVSCGDDSVLNPEPDPLDDLYIQEFVPIFVADESGSSDWEYQQEYTDPKNYPDGYCESDFWLLECGENSALIATGLGCLKNIYMVFSEEASQYCDD